MSDPPNEYWNGRYRERAPLWSGRANAVLVDVAASLTPGRALDLGCGEGGDAVWLAEQGWHATGVDISSAALSRAAELAGARTIPATRLLWEEHDLATWTATEKYELVSACFLYAPNDFPREQALRNAAAAVVPEGVLLVVGHARLPPWSNVPADQERNLPTPQEEIDALDLEPDAWDVLINEVRNRDAVGRDGERAVLEDTVVLIRRRH